MDLMQDGGPLCSRPLLWAFHLEIRASSIAVVINMAAQEWCLGQEGYVGVDIAT